MKAVTFCFGLNFESLIDGLVHSNIVDLTILVSLKEATNFENVV